MLTLHLFSGLVNWYNLMASVTQNYQIMSVLRAAVNWWRQDDVTHKYLPTYHANVPHAPSFKVGLKYSSFKYSTLFARSGLHDPVIGMNNLSTSKFIDKFRLKTFRVHLMCIANIYKQLTAAQIEIQMVMFLKNLDSHVVAPSLC